MSDLRNRCEVLNFELFSECLDQAKKFKILKIVISGNFVSDFYKFCVRRDFFDPVTKKEIIESGLIGYYLGHRIFIEEKTEDQLKIVTDHQDFIYPLIRKSKLEFINELL